MKIEAILRRKGHDVHTIARSRTVLEAVQVLVDRNIGALVVVEDQRPVGIVSERDVLRLTARTGGDLNGVRVEDIMTRKLITARPDEDLEELMDTMTENRIRHLPLLDGDRLAGIVSIGDLVDACRRSAEEENSQLREYIHGAG